MAHVEVVGGIKGEFKSEPEEIVEIGLKDILNNQSDGKDPVNIDDENNNANSRSENIQNRVSGQASGSKVNLGSNLEKHIKNNEKDGLLNVRDKKKDHDKGDKHFKTTVNLEFNEKLVLNYTANEDLLDCVNRNKLKRKKDVNREKLKSGTKAVNSVSNQNVKNEGAPTSKDKVKVTSAATANEDVLDNVKRDELKREKGVNREELNSVSNRNDLSNNEETPESMNNVVWFDINVKKEGAPTVKEVHKVKVTRAPTANEDLLDNVNRDELKKVKGINREGLKRETAAVNSMSNQDDLSDDEDTPESVSDVDWSQMNLKNEITPTSDSHKVAVTRVPTANEDLLGNINRDELKREDVNREELKRGTKSVNSVGNRNDWSEFAEIPVSGNEVDWSQVYRTNMGTSISEDISKVKITRPPASSSKVLPSEYSAEGFDKFRCNHCQLLSNRKKNVKQHIRRRHRDDTKTYECPYCNFKSTCPLRYHIISMHKSKNEIDWFRCSQCSYKAKIKHALTKHMVSHLDPSEMMDRMHRCDRCPKMYKSRNALRRHLLTVHERHRLPKLMCTECDYECINPCSLENHRIACHSNPEDLETLKCDKCNYQTKVPHRFLLHTKCFHAKNSLQCDKCAYRTNSRLKLNLHLIGHQEVKSEADLKYRCDKCDYKTYRQYSLNVHKLNHLKPEEIQFFYCYHCDFKAKRKDNLKTHVLRHFKHGEVTFQCYICDFTTKQRHKLAQHIDRHSNGTNDMLNEITEVTKSEEGQNKEPKVDTNTNKKNTGPRHSKGTTDMENEKTEVTKSEEDQNKEPRVDTNTNKKNTGPRHSKGTNDMKNEKTEVTKSEEEQNKEPRVDTNTNKKNTGPRHSKGTNDMKNEKTEVTKSEEEQNKEPRVDTNTNKKNTGQKKNRKRKAAATTEQAKVTSAPKTGKNLKTELNTSTEEPSDEAKSPKDEVMSLVQPLRKSERLRKDLKGSA